VEDLVGAAFGSHAIIAVGDRFAGHPAVLGAAQMPGVRALIVIVRGSPDLTTLRKKGVPYTVLRVGVLLEDVQEALAPAIARGRLVLDPQSDTPIHAVSAADVATCAVSSISEDSVCGRVITLSAPCALPLSELATRLAEATGRTLTVSRWPKWAVAALRAIGRAPLELPDGLKTAPAYEDLSMLHPGPWQTPENFVLNLERRHEHAMGM
jgi:hypothetical protein